MPGFINQGNQKLHSAFRHGYFCHAIKAAMNEPMYMRILIISCFLLAVDSCTSQPEKDAACLAKVQQKRMEMIMQMLITDDTALLGQFETRLMMAEREFNMLKSDFENKYADPVSKALFDSAFSRALKNAK